MTVPAGARVNKEFPFPVPVWVGWIAQEASGSWWGYSVEPLRHDSGWYENEVGRCVRLGETPPADWASSLRPVRYVLVGCGTPGIEGATAKS